jgi:peptidoglycan hydrolase-like protein with peptidoglycan-binding domain
VTSEQATLLINTRLALLRRGDAGATVRKLQALLNAGDDAGLDVDGDFGPLTERAVRDFQASRHLAVDGIVGVQTWTALVSSPPRLADIVIEQPQPFDIVDDPIKLAGMGQAFEATIATRARDADGNQIARSFVMGGSAAIANFQGSLGMGATPPTPQGTLEVFEVSAKDGSELNKVTVPITFASALIDNYEGYVVHTVVEGDTLSGLAQRFYGDASTFPRILEANRNVVFDPDQIFPGQELRIPVGTGFRF